MVIKKLEDIESFIAGDDTIIKEWLHPKNGDPEQNYSLAHATLEVKKSSLSHVLAGSSEVYIILQGEGIAFINKKAFPLKKGELIHIPAGAEQYITNTGSNLLQFLCIVSPPWSKEEEIILDNNANKRQTHEDTSTI